MPCDNSLMRILVVCQYYYPERFSVTDICENLVRRGHDVTVVTGLPNYGFGRIVSGYAKKRYEEINGVKVHRVKLYPRKKGIGSLMLNYLSFWFSAKRFFRSFAEDFDVVYAVSLSPLISIEGGALFARRNQIPLLIHCLDLWPESAVAAWHVRKGGLFYGILLRWSRHIYALADKILISSPSFADYFRSVLRIEKPMAVIMQPPAVAASCKPKELPDRINLVYAGNVGRLQLVENIIEAIALLPSSCDVCLYVIGNGSRLPAAEKAAKRLHLEGKVIFLGLLSQEEASSYLASATAIIVSLEKTDSPVSSTVPSKLLTALSFGKPLLGIIGGDGEAMLREAGGSFMSGEKPAAIASACEALSYASKETLAAMGTANRKYFEDHFSFSKVMDALEKELISAKKR